MMLPAPGIELRQLRAFAVLAEELHFGRAAERLGIAQPPLSQQIRRLEARVGHPLLERGNRRVTLTPAGRTFLEVAQRILVQMAEGLEATRRAGRGEAGRLRLGFSASVALTVLPGLVRAYRHEAPQVDLRLHEMTTAPQLEALRRGDLDAGLLREVPEDPALASLPLLREPYVAVLPAAHPAARSRRVAPAVLADDPFILFPRADGPVFHDAILGLCREAGFQPRIVQEAVEWQTIASLVGAGIGVSVAPACVARLRLDGVAYRPLSAAAADAVVALCWRRDDGSPVLARFLRIARDMPADAPQPRR